MSDTLDLAVVVPVFNEIANVSALVKAMDSALAGYKFEIIFVDDNSPDGTADAIRSIGLLDHRVRVIQRIGRRGLSSACIEGMCATAARHVAVMDGDLQHDERLLPQMLETFRRRPSLNLVIGSRFVDGGGTGDWDEDRIAKSALATRISRQILDIDLADPMSGFFMIETSVARSLVPKLSGIGFKILLDLVTASGKPLSKLELPYVFRTRRDGDSKLDYVVAMEYLIALYDRKFGKLVPVRFALFSLIGVLGLAVHMTIISLFILMFGQRDFLIGQAVATFVAMTFNFFLNNALTYREKRLRGTRELTRGWLSFVAVCSIGALANIGVAALLYNNQTGAWAFPAFVGVLAGAVWNYALSSRFTWGRY